MKSGRFVGSHMHACFQAMRFGDEVVRMLTRVSSVGKRTASCGPKEVKTKHSSTLMNASSVPGDSSRGTTEGFPIEYYPGNKPV